METLTQFAIEWGYLGLFVTAFVAGSIFPFSSEAVLAALIAVGLSPVGCVVAAAVGNTLGGMTCYWIGSLGKAEWIRKLGISDEKLEKAKRFLAGRGAWMAFFAFLPTIGEAIAVVLGLMRSNPRLTTFAMFIGKALRYGLIAGGMSLF
ncbi:MAG: YqaA family protein [Rikenellaceae bacterium]|nr:YqaA family protein [Rikenellaceae bacterium]